MPHRHFTIYLLAFCALCAPLFGQDGSKPSTSAADFDLPALTRETQQTLNEPGYLGLVWWIPTQYWELVSERAGMSEEKAKERYAALRKHTVVVVVVGKTGIGNIITFLNRKSETPQPYGIRMGLFTNLCRIFRGMRMVCSQL